MLSEAAQVDRCSPACLHPPKAKQHFCFYPWAHLAMSTAMRWTFVCFVTGLIDHLEFCVVPACIKRALQAALTWQLRAHRAYIQWV